MEGESSVISRVTDSMASSETEPITSDQSEMKNDVLTADDLVQCYDIRSPAGRSDTVELTKVHVFERRKRRKRRQSRSTSCKKNNDLNQTVLPNEDKRQDVTGNSVFTDLLPSSLTSNCPQVCM